MVVEIKAGGDGGDGGAGLAGTVSGAEKPFVRSEVRGAWCQMPVGLRVGSSWHLLELELPEFQTPQRHSYHTRIMDGAVPDGENVGAKQCATVKMNEAASRSCKINL